MSRKLKQFIVSGTKFSCIQLFDHMHCSMPGLPVHHQLLEFIETHVHWVGDAIQPSHPLSSPSFPAFNLSQPQGLFQWVSSSHQVAKVLEFQLQHQSFPEKAMATHSSTLAWKIPWMEEPGRLQSMGSWRVRHNWATSLSLHFHALEKEMATHSSVLAWRLPGTGEPGGLPSMGSHRVGHNWRDLAAPAAASILPLNTQDWSPLGWTGWISLQSKGISRVFSNTTGEYFYNTIFDDYLI